MEKSEIEKEPVTFLLVIKLFWRSILFSAGICIIAFSIYFAINFFNAFNDAGDVFRAMIALMELLIMAVCVLIGVVLIK